MADECSFLLFRQPTLLLIFAQKQQKQKKSNLLAKSPAGQTNVAEFKLQAESFLFTAAPYSQVFEFQTRSKSLSFALPFKGVKTYFQTGNLTLRL